MFAATDFYLPTGGIDDTGLAVAAAVLRLAKKRLEQCTAYTAAMQDVEAVVPTVGPRSGRGPCPRCGTDTKSLKVEIKISGVRGVRVCSELCRPPGDGDAVIVIGAAPAALPAVAGDAIIVGRVRSRDADQGAAAAGGSAIGTRGAVSAAAGARADVHLALPVGGSASKRQRRK